MFICANCGYKALKWMGRCPSCNAWESFVEESPLSAKKSKKTVQVKPISINALSNSEEERVSTKIEEFDRVLGGGIVSGEVILLGGEPGIGKSTLLLEAADKLAGEKKVLYVSAEESINQINLRAKRLEIKNNNLFIVNEDNLEGILPLFDKGFDCIIIDSIQVVHIASLNSAKGSLLQVRESANILTETAKKKGIPVIIVGHVTKDGAIAGPKVLEHIVDCVIYFEGEKNSSYRVLRAVKNRFGPVGEIGVFEMVSRGLKEVKNPSSVFISSGNKSQGLSGRSISCVLEGMRPLLVEIQALVTKGVFGMVRRKSSGFDFNRFSLLTAVLEKRLGLHMASQDIFINVAGGIRINDPAADLALITAAISSFQNLEIDSSFIFIAEVGLSGELRGVRNILARLNESKRMGFSSVFISRQDYDKINLKDFLGLKVHGFENVRDVAEKIKARGV